MPETVNRRDAILAAARGEFAAHGYFGARVERIAAAASANKQLIFHYFGSKGGLYSAMVAAVVSESPLGSSATRTPPDAVRSHVSSLVAWLIQTPGAALAIVECRSGRDVPAEARSGVDAWMQSQTQCLGGLVEDGQRQGFFRDDVEAQAVVDIAIGSAIGLALSGLDISPNGGGSTGLQAMVAQIVVDYCAWR